MLSRRVTQTCETRVVHEFSGYFRTNNWAISEVIQGSLLGRRVLRCSLEPFPTYLITRLNQHACHRRETSLFFADDSPNWFVPRGRILGGGRERSTKQAAARRLRCFWGQMKTVVYVDGFNLYYGLLRGTAFKWLDLYRLFQDHILGTTSHVDQRYVSCYLSKLAHWHKAICPLHMARAQLPAKIPGTPLRCPDVWRASSDSSREAP